MQSLEVLYLRVMVPMALLVTLAILAHHTAIELHLQATALHTCTQEVVGVARELEAVDTAP